jgi:hypothetical protein
MPKPSLTSIILRVARGVRVALATDGRSVVVALVLDGRRDAEAG